MSGLERHGLDGSEARQATPNRTGDNPDLGSMASPTRARVLIYIWACYLGTAWGTSEDKSDNSHGGHDHSHASVNENGP